MPRSLEFDDVRVFFLPCVLRTRERRLMVAVGFVTFRVGARAVCWVLLLLRGCPRWSKPDRGASLFVVGSVAIGWAIFGREVLMG